MKTINEFLDKIADSIKDKKKIEENIKFKDFKNEIDSLPDIKEEETKIANFFEGNYENGYFYSSTEHTNRWGIFIYDTNIKKVEFPNLRGNIPANSFQDCSNLKEVIFPKLESIGGAAFGRCTSLVEVNFPECWRTNDTNIFGNCTSLKKVSFPKLKKAGSKLFNGCTSLTEINFPEIENINEDIFLGCKNITKIDFGPNFKELINPLGLDKTSKLKYFILRSNEVVILSDSNLISYFNDLNVKILVPEAILEEYKTKTNWSIYSDLFDSIENNIGILEENINE